MNKVWLILDCNYLCHRAKHTTGNLRYEENATGVVFGFLKEVLHFQKMFKTSHIVFCWDSKTNKRKDVFPDYKSGRKDRYKNMTKEEIEFEIDFRRQMKNTRKEYLKTMGFKNIFCQKGYESDDLIASICHNLSDDDEAIIISSDKDLYQLLSFNIRMYNPQKNKMTTTSSFKKQYQIKSIRWGLVKAIAGCPTDGVPGVVGVGEKYAIQYLTGKMKEHTKTYQKITCRKGMKVYKRNCKLVRLPFKGTRVFKLKEDKFSKRGWNKIVKSLGMQSIIIGNNK